VRWGGEAAKRSSRVETASWRSLTSGPEHRDESPGGGDMVTGREGGDGSDLGPGQSRPAAVKVRGRKKTLYLGETGGETAVVLILSPSVRPSVRLSIRVS